MRAREHVSLIRTYEGHLADIEKADAAKAEKGAQRVMDQKMAPVKALIQSKKI